MSTADMIFAIADAFGIDLERIPTSADAVPLGLADHKSPDEITELVRDWLKKDPLEHALWISHTAQCGACADPFVVRMKERMERDGF